MDDSIDRFVKALLSLKKISARQVLADVRGTMSPLQLAEEIVAPALERIGDDWQQGDAALSQVYMSGRICEKLVDELLPPKAPIRKDQPKMAITVLNDFHLLGKRIVYSILRASGFELLDYGRLDSAEITDRVRADEVKILLISTLMLRSALQVKNICERLKDLPMATKVVVGGAPFLMDDLLWQEVGADAMGRTASDAVRLVTELAGKED